MSTMFDTLLQLPLFQGLCQEDFSFLLEKARFHFLKFEEGEYIAKQNTPCDKIFFILRGELAVQTEMPEENFVFTEYMQAPYVMEPYTLFGLNRNYSSSYYAHTTVEAISLEKSFCLVYMLKYEIPRLNFVNMLSRRCQYLSERLWDTFPSDLEGRVVQFFQMHSEKQTGAKSVRIKMSDLARILNCTRLNVSKVLNSLEDRKLLTLGRKTIYIPELADLIAVKK